MSDSLLDALCDRNAQLKPYLYQMDKSGRIVIMWDCVDWPADNKRYEISLPELESEGIGSGSIRGESQ